MIQNTNFFIWITCVFIIVFPTLSVAENPAANLRNKKVSIEELKELSQEEIEDLILDAVDDYKDEKLSEPSPRSNINLSPKASTANCCNALERYYDDRLTLRRVNNVCNKSWEENNSIDQLEMKIYFYVICLNE